MVSGAGFRTPVAAMESGGDHIRMPRLLWRYTCVELLKVMLLTTAVLVVVIAFGATIKPLIQNKLDPLDVGKYALIASVPMLQFALPFSAGFAATIVMHRMTSDNEILAMSTSGLSYRKIFTPIFSLGVLLTVIMLALTNFAVPHFWGLLQEMVTRDVTRVFTTTIERGEALSVGRTQLFADDVIVSEERPDTGADERLILLGVAALEVDANGEPRAEFTARYATVDIHHRKRDALLKLALVDATIFRPEDGSLIFVPKAVPDAVSLRKDLSSGPKTMNFLELLELREDPTPYPPVESARSQLSDQLALADAWECIAAILERNEVLTLESAFGIERISIEGAQLNGEQLVGEPVFRVTQYEDDEPVRRAELNQADFDIYIDQANQTPQFEFRASTDSALDLRGRGDLKTRWPARIRGLSVAQCETTDRSSSTNDELLSTAAAVSAQAVGPASALVAALDGRSDRLNHEITSVRADILARLVHRGAQSLTALLLLLVGAVLALVMRNALPLTIYFLAFLPAIADLLLISGGEQMVKYGDAIPGTLVAFSGNALLILIVTIGWLRLCRN